MTVPLALAMGAKRRMGFTGREDVDDRVYRLHYNAGQNRTDVFASIGAVAGIGFAAAAVAPRQALVLKQWVGAAAQGGALGILAHVLTHKPKARVRTLLGTG